ncbi:PaaI family thioesterase [Limnohabitans sp. 103DPR2]|jgi:uncharacterized protein (TIGR00369 family)|uniref:PaaI family thioesterase n=1 Tax=Limnohabitans sp. 103DPR2 TaxID=1678129 RepID=UPI0006DC1ADF|nr:PaaI family thioesterase [Limnohabitans sp. 103DPR2]ALK92192.1 hypothetical protein L103DPR2_01794 [Limnohabitans sp. 103DPR2]
MSIPFGVHIPFVDNLGFTLEKFENGTSELHYSPRAEHHNSFAITHGGAVMTLLDVVMATAARSVEQEMGVVTIEMKTSFMRPAKTTGDEHLLAKGLLLHRTKTMAFTDGKVYDADGQLCAHATGTFKYVKRTPSVSSPISTD